MTDKRALIVFGGSMFGTAPDFMIIDDFDPFVIEEIIRPAPRHLSISYSSAEPYPELPKLALRDLCGRNNGHPRRWRPRK